MFGLPLTTTIIMALIMGFWVVYTLVFYFSTRRWSIEDADYGAAASPTETAATVRARGRSEDSA